MICTYLNWLQQFWQLKVRFNNTLLVHLLQKYIKHCHGYESSAIITICMYYHLRMTRFEHKDDPVHFVVFFELMLGVGVRVMVFNITFNNMAVISWRLVILMEENGVFEENHRPVASHWQTSSHNVVSNTTRDNTEKISIGLKSTIWSAIYYRWIR